MSKANRLRNRRRSIPGVPDSPYADAFTQAEWDEALARTDHLMRFARDAVRVTDGTILGIDEGTLQLLMLHLALAGITQDDALALIRPKVLPDETGRLMAATTWIPKRFDSERARRADAEEEARRHKAALDVAMAQMTPEARNEYVRMFRPAAEAMFTTGARAEAHRLDAAAEETEEATRMRETAQRLREEGRL